MHVVHQILQHTLLIVSSVQHRYPQHHITLLGQVSLTMFLPNFEHSYNLKCVCEVLIVVIPDVWHEPKIQHFFNVTNNAPFHAILQSVIQVYVENTMRWFFFCLNLISSHKKQMFTNSVKHQYYNKGIFPDFLHRKQINKPLLVIIIIKFCKQTLFQVHLGTSASA